MEPGGKGFGWVESYPIGWLAGGLEQAESTQVVGSVTNSIRRQILQTVGNLERCSRSRESVKDTTGCLVQSYHTGEAGGVKD